MHNTTESNPSDGHHVKVDPAGRILVPAAIRARYNIHTGDILVVRPHKNSLEVRTYAQVLREAQDYFCSLAPANRVLSEELIEERRHDAETE